MSIWKRISEALEALRNGEPLSVVFDHLLADPEHTVAFTIAVIGLSAKMAKADGQVTRDEVSAFRDVFYIAREDEEAAGKVFNLARQDVNGFAAYATRIKRMFRDRPEVLRDLMDGLFHIAMSDGVYHPAEDRFLQEVSEIFGLSDAEFVALRRRHAPGEIFDPFEILGVTLDTPMSEIRQAWRRLVKENHPDRLMARGVPKEAIKLAEKRLYDINRAWKEISGEN